jgi:hypothetical protein
VSRPLSCGVSVELATVFWHPMTRPDVSTEDSSRPKWIRVVLRLLLAPLLVLGFLAAVLLTLIAASLAWISWPLRKWWKRRPFDAILWKNNPPYHMGAYTSEEVAELDPSGEKHLQSLPGYEARDTRYWMVDDAMRRIRGKLREEVVALLGEPDGPYPPGRSLLVDNPESWHMAYALSPDALLGRPELLIRFDSQGRVREAKVDRSVT